MCGMKIRRKLKSVPMLVVWMTGWHLFKKTGRAGVVDYSQVWKKGKWDWKAVRGGCRQQTIRFRKTRIVSELFTHNILNT